MLEGRHFTRFKEVQKFVADEYLPLIYLVGSAYPDLFKTGIG